MFAMCVYAEYFILRKKREEKKNLINFISGGMRETEKMG